MFVGGCTVLPDEIVEVDDVVVVVIAPAPVPIVGPDPVFVVVGNDVDVAVEMVDVTVFTVDVEIALENADGVDVCKGYNEEKCLGVCVECCTVPTVIDVIVVDAVEVVAIGTDVVKVVDVVVFVDVNAVGTDVVKAGINENKLDEETEADVEMRLPVVPAGIEFVVVTAGCKACGYVVGGNAGYKAEKLAGVFNVGFSDLVNKEVRNIGLSI
ncbi:Hypothetical predicted protein [Mytilus galloprovincialis]|uniref:Uncharacterized protein n=1 Tax=Mytilus galloprovincialis TaxID=29158 RepID=A0A8B6BR63_MYTGA|nr:Hypothetical predicted protein [Mytilus galloprovincialis]